MIILFCKEDSKWYAQIYDRSNDIAVFGSIQNQATCITLDNDRFKEITEADTCCDENTTLILGSFDLDGLSSCALFSAHVEISNIANV